MLQWSIVYAADTTRLDAVGFKYEPLGVFVYNQLIEANDERLDNEMVNLKTNRAQKSEWLIQHNITRTIKNTQKICAPIKRV